MMKIKCILFQTCVKLIFDNGYTGYFSVGNSIPTLKENCIGISSLYCKTLGIKEDELVLLSEISSVPTINSITVTPTSESDYDIIVSIIMQIQFSSTDCFLGIVS